jgi:hypothetical protein
MNLRYCKIVLFYIAISSLFSIWFHLYAQQSVKKYSIFEITLTANNSYVNAYKEGSVTATFISPRDCTLTVPGFWDGGSTWKVRISPNETGGWTYSTASADNGLVVSGNFICIECDSTTHGGIKARNDSPYHFQYEDGKPFWWFGETCWAGFITNPSENLTNETYKNYVDVRSSQGFNYIHCFALMGPNNGGEPFIGAIGELVNPYFWREVDQRMVYMNSKGITVGFMLAWKEGQWTNFADQASRRRYCKYVAARYSAYNVVWILSGEYDEEPGSDPNSVEKWTELAQELQTNDPHHRMITIHGTGSVEDFADCSWMSFGDYMQMYDNLHTEMLGSRKHNKSVINAEYAYFLRDKNGDGVVDKPNSATLEEFRNASWDILMSNGYFVTGFGTTYAGGEKDPGPFDVYAPKNDPAEEDLQHMKLFFTSLEWWKLQPADESVIGKGTYYCLREIGKQYAVYVRGTSGPITLNLGTTEFINYFFYRFNPRTGEWQDSSTLEVSGSMILVPPDRNDWLFNLKFNFVVPVELSSFNVRMEQGQILLEWTTETETNNFGFEIQRKTPNDDFKRIGFVAGHGTTSMRHNYHHVDTHPSCGTYFYRLKQIDNNGSFIFSESRSIVLFVPLTFKLEKNYPNPFNLNTTIRYQIANDFDGSSSMSLIIHDTLGKVVKKLFDEPQSPGQYAVTWDGRDEQGNIVSSGVYLCRLITKNYISTLKIAYVK